MSTGNASAQNNVITSAEYQQAADEITEIINVQRAERAPIEAQQELLRNRQELLISRQQTALNTLQAAEADPGNTAFLEASRTAYASVTNEVNATNQAIQQNRSVLAQSRLSTAELQEQRGRLEVNADLAAQGAPTLNSLPPPATTAPDQSATYVAPPPPPIIPVVAATTADGTAGEAEAQAALQAQTPAGQNNLTTAAEYQQAADEITAIIDAQRAERAPLEAELDLLRNRTEIQAQRQQIALDALRDAEDIGDAAAIASATTAYQRATNDLVVTNQAQQQVRSSLAQSRQATAELQEQRGNLEVNAELAAKGAPTLNSLPPPATVIPDQPATYVEPPAAPVLTQSQADPQPEADIPPLAPAGENNVSVAEQWGEVQIEISSAARGIRAENAAIADNISSLQSQGAEAARIDRALENQIIDARLAGASDLEIAQLEALQIQAAARTAEINNQITRQESVLAQNQETLIQLQQQRFIAEEAEVTALTGIPGLNSVPTPATVVPDQDPAAFDLPPQTYAESFQADLVSTDGDEALAAFAEAQLAQQEGAAFAVDEPLPVDVGSDEELRAIEDAQAADLAAQEGTAFAEPVTLDDPEARAIQDAIDADLAAQEGTAFAEPVTLDDPEARAIQDAIDADLAAQEGTAFAEPVTLDDPEARAIQDAIDADLAAQEGLAFPPIDNPAPVSGDEALQAIEDAEAADLARQESIAFAEPLDVPASGDEALQAIEDAELAAQEGSAFVVAEPLAVTDDPAYGGATADEQAAINQAIADSAAGSATAAGTANAQRQSTLQARKNQPAAADWRVRIQLAPGANYLYAVTDKESRGILAPLYDTDGVIFPYMPSIETSYKAKYDSYDLVHSNYRGYFYKNSNVEEISIKGTFTAQDTREAQYLLAVIHFFRSVTKMFYGQDAQAGTPPPLVYLSGLGQYQFNNHTCLVSSFNYSLPTDVDYIRADGFNNIGVNLENRRSLGSGPAPGGAVGTIQRLLTNGLNRGAQPKPPAPGPVVQNVTNQNSINSTYVPTKMDITVTLLPIQTRNQVSQQFSLAGFAQGRLLKGGFW